METFQLRKALRLYAITDRKALGKRNLQKTVEEILQNGVTCLQLREKQLSERELIAEIREILPVCRAYGVPLIVNDNPRAALEGGADGVHVGAEDMPVAEIRRQAGKDFIIGATAKTVKQAKDAAKAGADYLGVGAVFPSPTKENAIRITKEELREICAAVAIPAVAIGGISLTNAKELSGSGIAGIAVVSALFGAEQPSEAAGKLRALAEKIVEMKA